MKQKRENEWKFKQIYAFLCFSGANNILECISNGACHSSKFVWAIGANLVVYLALLALLNKATWWLGDTVGIKDLSFNVGFKILVRRFWSVSYTVVSAKHYLCRVSLNTWRNNNLKNFSKYFAETSGLLFLPVSIYDGGFRCFWLARKLKLSY